MKTRLLDYARELIARQVSARALRGGVGMTDADGTLDVIPRAPVPGATVEAATWVLALFATKTTYDSVFGVTESELQAVAFLPRFLGLPAVTDLIWWEGTQLRAGSEPPSTKTASIEFFTRRFDAWPGSFPLPTWDEGTPYGGTVALTLREQKAVDGPGVTTHTVIIPPEGSGTIAFTASPLVPANTVTELRPQSVARVRT